MKMKKIFTWLLAVLFAGTLITVILSRTVLNDFISKKMKEQAGHEDLIKAEKLINDSYNYFQNGADYDFTLLEFGSTGCTVCKQMEPVLEEIKTLQNPNVNVVFLHIMQPKNLPLMKYYGISAVPMQILLDKNGKEIFRHYGFISAADLKNRMNFH